MIEDLQKRKLRNLDGGGWYWVHNRVLDEYGKSLGPYGIATYNALCRFANQEQVVFPSQKVIAEKIGASRSTVSKQIRKLQKLGLVAVKKTAGSRTLYLLLETSGYPVENRGADVPGRNRDVSQGNSPAYGEGTNNISKETK